MPKHVFISYKREELPFAKRLRDIIQSWGFETWLDVDNIPAGLSPDEPVGWQRTITEAIQNSLAVVGILTPESIQSDIVLGEWECARQNEVRLLLLRLRGVRQGDIPVPFNLLSYIDLVADESRGLQELREALESPVKLSSRQIGTPPPLAPPPAEPPPTPEPSRRVPWSWAFQVIALLTFIVALIWIVAEPGFEPLLAFLGAVTSQLLSFASRPQDMIRRTDRDKMLDRVETNWIDGVLKPALSERESLTIRHQFKPDMVLKSANTGDYRLPPDARIVDIFRELRQELLILGEPGAGKTVMLLQLAQDLIAEARRDVRKPIPVVLNLASWALKREPLDDWIVAEMGKVYQVSAGVVRDWLNGTEILLLLDGLDEVKEDYRDACVTAINEFRKPRKYGHIRMAVCSRIRDYQRLSAQLDLFAILLEPLTQDQINAYLAADKLNALRDVIAGDDILKDMAQTPFLLNTMAYAYQDTSRIGLASTPYERRTHLFEEYIQRRFAGTSGWRLVPAREYLTWLATKMQAYVQTVFFIDDMDADWLRTDGRQYRTFWAILGALVIVPLVAVYIAVGLLGSTIWAGLVLGATGFLLGYAAIDMLDNLRQTESIRFVGWRKLVKSITDELEWQGVAILSALALSAALPELASGWLAGLVVVTAPATLLFVYLQWNEVDDLRAFARATGIALLLAGALAIYAVIIASLLTLPWLANGLLTWGVTMLITTGLLAFEPQPLHVKTAPNAGIQSALRTALAVGLLAGLAFGLTGWWLRGVGFGLALGIAAGLSLNVWYGGMTVIQHVALRLTLSARKRKAVPSRLNAFLRAMTGKNILRSIGGGYIFRHRYLLEHFAVQTEVIAGLILQLPAERAEEALIEIGSAAVEPLVLTLQDRNVKVRASAGRVLGQLGDPRPGVGLRRDGTPDIAWSGEIPAGMFRMGGDPSARNAWAGAEFNLPYPFWIARYPVTYAQYEPFVAATGRQLAEYWNDPKWHIANHPVVGVTWNDAYAYTQWLDDLRQQGKLRLPDEIPNHYMIRLARECEWEKAARYPDGRLWPWGNDWDDGRHVNWYGGRRIERTSAVGIFSDGNSPNGASDLIGNVWEWCLTEWADRYESPEAENDRPPGDAWRVARGGSFGDLYDYDCRAAARYNWYPRGRSSNWGFRVVVSVPIGF